MSTTKIKLPPMRELRFGNLDASQEAADDPDLLRQGFYDYRQAAYGISAGEVWLLLGPKGAGKSAVLEHLRLEWRDRFDRFFTYWDLRAFPVTDVAKIQKDLSPGSSRAQASWEFLLLIRLIESLARDASIGSTDGTFGAPRAFRELQKALGSSGLTDGDWRTRVAEWSKMSATFKLPLVEMGFEATNNPVTMLRAGDILKRIISTVRTDNRHIIALDGLDGFFFEVEDEWSSLAGLMGALESLNRFLRTLHFPASIVAAVRSDVFDVLDDPETNKLKPRSIHLDWSALGIGVGNHLWELLSEKVRVARPEVVNVASQYLHGPIGYGYNSVAEYLLDRTRMLPRDVVALMGFVQREHRGSSAVQAEAARNAAMQYAKEYFIGEIFNNLAGILGDEDSRKMAAFRDAIRTVPTRTFTFDDVQSELAGELEPHMTKRLIKQMFEVGGVGIVNSSGSGVAYTNFAFRNVTGAGFSTRYKFVLHNSLTMAWNRPWR